MTTVPRFSARVVRGDARLQLGGDALHDLAAHDELGDEDLLAGEPLAERGHRRARVVEDRLRGFAGVQAVLDDLERAVLVHGEDGVGELSGHAASLLSSRASTCIESSFHLMVIPAVLRRARRHGRPF